MTNELDKQKVLEWAENKRGRYDFNYWFSEFITEVSKGSFDSNRVAELEEQLKQAKVSLMKITDNVAETGEDAREMHMEAEYALSILSQETEDKL